MFDALVISDLHLGGAPCQARALVQFLEEVRSGELPARRLILNGDVFDSIDFRRLNKHHWKVLSMLRKLSDEVEIVWIVGNHDGDAEAVSQLLGVEVREEYEIESGGRRVLFLHGHQFDEFIGRYPWTSHVADLLYRLLQRIDRSHTIARTAKHSSKTFLRCARKVQERAVSYAAKRKCDAVCCGHTHHPVGTTGDAVEYFNGGSWTERPCHYLAVADGVVELHSYAEAVEAPALGVVAA